MLLSDISSYFCNLTHLQFNVEKEVEESSIPFFIDEPVVPIIKTHVSSNNSCKFQVIYFVVNLLVFFSIFKIILCLIL
jgi:hypothetical protein